MFDLIKLQPCETELAKQAKEYIIMANDIQQNLPMIYEASSHFGKNQSQFMDNFLTIAHPTPLRNARQILAEINKSVEALKEAQYNINKKQLLIQRLERDLTSESDDIKRQEIELEINYETSKIANTMLYVKGAIRAVTNYTEQYKQILKVNGYDEMSEIDFEKEEEIYHIMKAFEQAICAARARDGVVDEGNHIYFSQIGVNGQMAQEFINKFFEQEREALSKGAVLTANFQRDFLKNMADYFKGCSNHIAKSTGITPLNTVAMLKSKLEDKESA